MFLLVIVIACLLAVAIGYLFNIYVVLAFTVLLCFIYVKENSRPNPYPGTSGNMGAMIIAFIVLVPFIVTMLITSSIVNQDKAIAFFKTITRYFSIVFLR